MAGDAGFASPKSLWGWVSLFRAWSALAVAAAVRRWSFSHEVGVRITSFPDEGRGTAELGRGWCWRIGYIGSLLTIGH